MKIAYALDSWPRLSESFVVREIAAVAPRHDVRVVALTRGDKSLVDPVVAALSDRVRVLENHPRREVDACRPRPPAPQLEFCCEW